MKCTNPTDCKTSYEGILTNKTLDAAQECTELYALLQDISEAINTNIQTNLKFAPDFNYEKATNQDYIDMINKQFTPEELSKTVEINDSYNELAKDIKDVITTKNTDSKNNLAELEKDPNANADDITKTKTLVEAISKIYADATKLYDTINNDIRKIRNINEIVESATKITTVSELRVLSDGALDKIAAIEQKLLYRSFYFPGTEIYLRKAGMGKDTIGSDGTIVKYDNIPGMDDKTFEHWDPRYLPEYVKEAQSRGFEKYFLYSNGKDIKSMNFEQAESKLRNCLKPDGSRKEDQTLCPSNEITGIVAGLDFFDKLGGFKQYLLETKSMLPYGAISEYLKLTTTNRDMFDKDLMNFLGGITKTQFKDPSRKMGFQDRSWKNTKENEPWKYVFDTGTLMKEWYEVKAQYDVYMKRVWEILSKTNALQICGNVNNSTSIGDVSINQAVKCDMTVNSNTEETSDEGGTTPSPPTPTPEPESSPSTPAPEPESSPSTPAPTPASTPAPTPSNNDDKKEDGNKMMIIIIVVVVVVFLLIMLIVIIVVVKKKPQKSTEDVEPTSEYVDEQEPIEDVDEPTGKQE